MPNATSGTEGRRRHPTLRGALLCAGVGVAVFLGVGAALPVWRLWPPWPPVGNGGAIFLDTPSWEGSEERGPLWQAIAAKSRAQEFMRTTGRPVRYLEPGDGVALVGLLISGAFTGALGYAGYALCTIALRSEGDGA
jgi:hypothetical protein